MAGSNDVEHGRPDQAGSTDGERNPPAEQGQKGNKGRGWHGDPQGHADAGRKGGTIVSKNRDHMVEIGRKGGQTVSQNREHMADIGRVGGKRRRRGGPEQSASGDQGSTTH
jgi:general stress protein YciG